MELLNGSGKYLEKIEIEDSTLKVYALGDFAKTHLTRKIERIKSKLPFEKYIVELSQVSLIIITMKITTKTMALPITKEWRV